MLLPVPDKHNVLPEIAKRLASFWPPAFNLQLSKKLVGHNAIVDVSADFSQ